MTTLLSKLDLLRLDYDLKFSFKFAIISLILFFIPVTGINAAVGSPGELIGSSTSDIAIEYGASDIAIDSSNDIIVLSGPNLLLIDQDTDTITKTVTFPGSIFGRSMVRDVNGNIYVSLVSNNGIRKYNSNLDFVTSFSTPQVYEANDLAADSSGNIYAIETFDAQIHKYNSSGVYQLSIGSSGTGNGQFSFQVGSIAIDSNDILYATDDSDGRIQKFNQSGTYLGTMVATVTGTNMVFDSSNNLYQSTSSGFTKIPTVPSESSATVYSNPGSTDGKILGVSHISFDSSNNIYFSGGRIQKFNSSLTFIKKYGSWGGGQGELGSAVNKMTTDTSGNIYITEGNSSFPQRVQKFDSNGNFLLEIGITGTNTQKLFNPEDVSVDSSGNIYVAQNSTIQGKFVKKYNSSGVFQWVTPSAVSCPCAIAVDSAGKTFVAERQNHRVRRLDASGNSLGTFGTSGTGNGQFSFPADIVVDNANNVYVVEAGSNTNRIQKFDNSGNYLSQWSVQLDLGAENILQYDYATNTLWVSTVNGAENYISNYSLTGTLLSELKLSDNIDGFVKSNDYYVFNRGIVNKLNILAQIANISPTLDVVDSADRNIEDSDSNGVTGLQELNIKLAAGTPLAKVQTDMSTDRDWGSLTGNADLVNGKSFVHNLASAPGVSGSYSLYVPRLNGHNNVTICPGATSLAAVTENCSGAVRLGLGLTGQYTVSVSTINSQEYWKIDGVTGTGGLSTAGYPGYISPTSFTITPNTSGISTSQNVTVTFVASAEFVNGNQIAIDFATGGNFTLASCASPTTDADGNGSNDGSGLAQTNGGPNNDRYVYNFTGNTAQASTVGISLCINVTSPATAGNYQVDLVDSHGDFYSALYYVGSENTLNVIGQVDPVLTLDIRNATDTTNLPNVNGSITGPNLCDLGNLSDSGVQECSYRLKVGTNASAGYTITLTSDGSLRKGTDFIDNVVENTTVTAGTEGYGIYLEGGSYDSDGSGVVHSPILCTESGDFNDDDTPIATGLLSGISTTLYSCPGPNSPIGTDVVNTALVRHRAEASASTPSGTYVHLVTYTVSASF